MKENLINPFKDKYPHYLSFSLTILLLALTFFLSMTIALQSQKIKLISEKFSLKTSNKEPIQEMVNTNNWKTLVSINGFTLKYPSTLIPFDNIGQVYLVKKDASDAERMDYSDRLVEITVDKATWRFEEYFNTEDNAIVSRFGDLKLNNLQIDGYNAVEYGYDEVQKRKEVDEQEKAINSGAQVGMIFFPKGLIINKDGTTIEVSTLYYVGEFKNTFDQILSTYEFAGVPDGYSDNLIDVKFKEGVNISNPNNLFPNELRTFINTITPLSSEAASKSVKINSGNLQRWFRISLKTDTNAVSFLQKVKDLDFVETAEYVPLPQPPP